MVCSLKWSEIGKLDSHSSVLSSSCLSYSGSSVFPYKLYFLFIFPYKF